MHRHTLLALAALGLGATAFAQPLPDASPKRKRPPAAAVGSAKDEDPAPPPAEAFEPAPAAPVGSEGDTALLRALLHAVEPAPTEIRVIAVEDLALLGDERALNPLAQLVFDPNPAVPPAALRAISKFRCPRAEEILANVLRHPQLSERLKLQALQALLFQRSPTSRELLARLKGAQVSPNLKASAARALQEWDPPAPRVTAQPWEAR